MRRLLVAGNWKMHGSVEMTVELITGVSQAVSAAGPVLPYDILVCPPAPFLAKAVDVVNNKDAQIYVGAQNVSAFTHGAYTGEIALPMLAELACKFVLLGHSERREHYAESDDVVAEKFAACSQSEAEIVPVLCVGETLAEREAGNTELVVARQINAVLEKTGIEAFTKTYGNTEQRAVIAYEPVWAIGTGKTASPEQAQEVHRFIRELLGKHSESVATKIQLLYGGSVKPANAQELFEQTDIDGGLIGGASLDVESFAGICEVAQKLALKLQ